MTDGEENSSKEFNRQQIFDLIKRKEAEGWTFVFLAANIDAWAVGQSIGLQASASYNAAAPDVAIHNLAVATTAHFRTARGKRKDFWK
jgi:hypothetical protein